MVSIAHALMLDFEGLSYVCAVCDYPSDYLDVQETGNVAYCDLHADES